MKQFSLNQIFSSRNLIRLVIGLPVGIFLAEVIAMVLVNYVSGPYWLVILIDALITTALMLPLIYVLSYSPLLRNIAERERAERIMQFRLRIMKYGESYKQDDLLRVILDEIETLTGSTIGFFHFVHEDQKTIWLQAWSTNTIENMCTAEGKDSHYDLEQAGIWADCIRQRQPVVHNDYAHQDNRKGLPDGHAPIIRELVVPVLRDEQVVAVLGMGNKAQKFTEKDVELVLTLSDFAWDIVERKQVQETLRESEEKFRTLVDWTYDWEQWVNPEGGIEYISPSCESSSGYSPEEFISDPTLAWRIIHPEDSDIYEEHMKVTHDETAGVSNVEYRIIARDGSEHWIDHICRPLFGKDNHYLGRRVSSRDITRRKLAEKEIMERITRETILTQTIHNMQMDVARDLHDTIGQNISYLRMRLDHLCETNLKTPLDLETELTNMLKVVDESYDLIRGTMDFLQSGSQDNLKASFTQYKNQIEERSPLKIDVTSQGSPKPLTQDQARQVFFVFREALSNIEKYANATNVSVQLKWTRDNFILMVADDGCGFLLEEMPSGSHYGIKFMKERIESIKGNFSIKSMDDKGTTIKISIPYEQMVSISS